VLYGNIAEEGCIVKTAGVDASILTFAGPARVFESQEAAVAGILGGQVVPGDVVVVRYEGPKGGPGMQEMLYPTSYLKSKGLGKVCALVTDGRFSGGSSGLSIGHVSPEAAEGGTIGLVEDGDRIEIDIPTRSIRLAVDEGELARRRAAMEARGEAAWQPRNRSRTVSAALQAYAALTTSAARGAGQIGVPRSLRHSEGYAPRRKADHAPDAARRRALGGRSGARVSAADLSGLAFAGADHDPVPPLSRLHPAARRPGVSRLRLPRRARLPKGGWTLRCVGGPRCSGLPSGTIVFVRARGA
jgi:hypothetical protein